MPRQYDPDYKNEDLISLPWPHEVLLAMDAGFVAAMQAAGYAITAPSTRAGTQAPVQGYQRPDGS